MVPMAKPAVDEHVLVHGGDDAVSVAGAVPVVKDFLRAKRLEGQRQHEGRGQKRAYAKESCSQNIPPY